MVEESKNAKEISEPWTHESSLLEAHMYVQEEEQRQARNSEQIKHNDAWA